jgi:hypothetical protein
MLRCIESAKWAVLALALSGVAGCSRYESAQPSPSDVVRRVAYKQVTSEPAEPAPTNAEDGGPAVSGAAKAPASEGSNLRTASSDSGHAPALPAEAQVEKPKIDPVAANGPIFVDWPKPQLALVFTGELDGYIEPCGCAGLENQLGGLKRRHTFIKQMQEKGWPLALFDVGGLAKRAGSQADIKYRYALEALAEMGYQAIAIGGSDLKVSADALAYSLKNFEPGKNPIVSANVGIYGLDVSLVEGFRRPYRVLEAGGKRIGVTSVLGAKFRDAYKNLSDIEISDPVEAISKVAPQLAAERCDLQVLLVHGEPAEADDLARKFPQFQIVAAAGGAEEPPARPGKIEGSTAVRIEAGHKGMYAVVLGIFDDPDPKKQYRYQRVPLDSRFGESPEMQARMVAYQKELETMTLAGLGLSGVANPDGEYAGSAACADCHTKAWAVYENTPHHHATDTLEKLDPPRHFDPECLSCHVTGWNPQEYFPFVSGYMGLAETPELVQNGCENCHGPAAAHVAVESGEVQVTPKEQQTLRDGLHLKVIANEGNKDGQALGEVVTKCMQCHDLDNSPNFDFQKWWPKVKHEGKD